MLCSVSIICKLEAYETKGSDPEASIDRSRCRLKRLLLAICWKCRKSSATILTTARCTHLTDGTNQSANQVINALMNGFALDWGKVK